MHGFVLDDEGNPIEGAKIIVDSRTKLIRTHESGDYWRLLVPGTYTIRAAKRHYKNSRKTVVIPEGSSISLNFTLVRKDKRKITGKTLGQRLNKTTGEADASFILTKQESDRLSLSVTAGNSASSYNTFTKANTSIWTVLFGFAFIFICVL